MSLGLKCISFDYYYIINNSKSHTLHAGHTLPLQDHTVKIAIGLDVLRHQHICRFASDVEVPAQPLPLQRHSQEVLRGLKRLAVNTIDSFHAHQSHGTTFIGTKAPCRHNANPQSGQSLQRACKIGGSGPFSQDPQGQVVTKQHGSHYPIIIVDEISLV